MEITARGNPDYKHIALEAAALLGDAAFLYLVSWWGFKRDVKEEIWNRQNGLSPEGKPIEENHHIVPEKALLKQGIKGKNIVANGVGLSKEEHKQKWDKLMMKGIFYPGVTLEELDPNTWIKVDYKPTKGKSSKKQSRRLSKRKRRR